MLAWDRLLREGVVAPWMAESGSECRRKLSQTSLRLTACVNWAKRRLTT